MKFSNFKTFALSTVALASLAITHAEASPAVSRLTPPSELFTSGQAAPVIARFLPGQRFDLQATLRPDDGNKTITSAQFLLDGKPLALTPALRSCAVACLASVPKNATIATVRAFSVARLVFTPSA